MTTLSRIFSTIVPRAGLMLLSTGLVACSSFSTASQSVPNLGQNTPAVYVQTHAPTDPTQIVTQYVPVPIPGQLMPIPTAHNQTPLPHFTSPTAAIDYANTQATVQPDNGSFFNAMMTYHYVNGALYTIYTAPLKITDISLQPGEKLISEAAGDTLRWQIAQTYSGSGSDLTQHILVKPNQSQLENTMVITTDQRVYHLVLQSTDQSYMASVQWDYPSNMVSYASPNANPGATPFASSSADTPRVDLTRLDFSYRFGMTEGDKPAWYPVRVFNDGRETFIQLPQNDSPAQMPVLYIADENGHYGTMVNWRYRAPYIIVDSVIQKARLQSGVLKTGQTIVQIEHT